MAGLDPAIHDFGAYGKKQDGHHWDEPGDDRGMIS
jgi:hypothetical protein